MQREAVTVEIDDVDVGCTRGNAILDNACTLVDQRKDAALDDLAVADPARRDATFGAVFGESGEGFVEFVGEGRVCGPLLS